MEYYAVTDKQALDAFSQLSRLEGIIPALESAHAFAYLEVRFAAQDKIPIFLKIGQKSDFLESYNLVLELRLWLPWELMLTSLFVF